MKNASSTKTLMVLALSLSACAADGAAEPASDEGAEHQDIDSSEQGLVNRDVPCGSSEGYPTWSWWGWTNVRFANRDASGTKILDVTYQAGAGEPRRAEIGSQQCEFSEAKLERSECAISQQWGGLTLYVTNYGYWDVAGDGSKGNYHPCVTATDGPSLNVISQ